MTGSAKQSIARAVIASAAKQSILPRKERMDCFAALAMTEGERRHATPSPVIAREQARECAPDDRLREAIHCPRRHCERSEAIHLAAQRKNGLLRCARNDGGTGAARHTLPRHRPRTGARMRAR